MDLTFVKNGVVVNKGAVVGEEWLENHWDLCGKYASFFTAYPDLFIDLITPSESSFKLFFYQRMFLRACLRYRYHYCVAPRAFSKTFVSLLGMFLKCVFQPGSKVFICAPKKDQSAKICKEKLAEIFDLFPILKREIQIENYGTDYVRLVFKNNSVFDVVGALDSTRGGRRHSGLIDEVRDHDGDTLNEVVLPLLNVNRRTAARTVNLKEPHQAQFYMTSAGTKMSYAYDKLMECVVSSIIDPESTFVWGCDYRVPMFHGLLDKKYLMEIKTSPTYKPESFAREYLGIWTGGGTTSWFNSERLTKCRVLVNPENARKVREGEEVFYLLSVDVARIGCQTTVSVFKVRTGKDEYKASLVNLYVLGLTAEDKHFAEQAADLKRIIKAFKPVEVVIDGNGLGVGLLDYMVRPSADLRTGEIFPAYGCINDDEYKKIQDPSAKQIIYVVKANAKLNSKIHSNCFSWVNSGKVKLLIKEQQVKTKMLSTPTGQKTSLAKRSARLQPHEMTSRLLLEMENLKIKPTGNNEDITLEMISKRKTKDKFSSFEYGLWRIKEREEQYFKKKRRGQDAKGKYMFYTQGGA